MVIHNCVKRFKGINENISFIRLIITTLIHHNVVCLLNTILQSRSAAMSVQKY